MTLSLAFDARRAQLEEDRLFFMARMQPMKVTGLFVYHSPL